MKKLLVLCFVAMSTFSFGQKEIAWFDVGLKAMYGGGFFLNQAVSDSPDLDNSLAFTNAYSFGGKFGINRGYNGLAVEVMLHNMNSDNTIQLLGSDYQPQIDLSSLDLYLLFRNAANLGFFELGPKISFVREVQTLRENGVFESSADTDIYNSKNVSGVLSFGVNVIGTDGAFSGQIGLRFEYGFLDLVADAGQAARYPLPDVPDLQTRDYASTHPIFVGLVFEMNWGLGFYGVAQCGGRPKFFSF